MSGLWESIHEKEINNETENGEPEENMESMDIVINEGEEDGSLNESGEKSGAGKGWG